MLLLYDLFFIFIFIFIMFNLIILGIQIHLFFCLFFLNISYYFGMITCIKNVNNFKIVKVQPEVVA